MKEQLETLKKWVQTGQVKTARGRSEDDLLTLIGQMQVALRQPHVIKSVSFDDFKTWGKCFETFITRNAIHRKWDTFIEEWELEHGKLPPDYTYYEKNEE